MEKDNLNPTILDPSDLPSRRRESTTRRRDEGGAGLFDDLIPRYSYLSDPFDDHAASTDSDEDVREDIDEQEIYGTPCFHVLCNHPTHHPLTVPA